MAGIKISADVDGAAFEAFAAKFEEHKAALDALPAAWKEIAGAATAAHSEFDRTASALAKHAASAGEITKQTTQLTHVSGALSSHWKTMRLNTAGVAANISEMTKSLLSWSGSLGKVVGIGLGAGAGVMGLAAGGFWAMDKLGQGVGAKRMRAQGLGTSIGGVASFETAFARLGNTAQMLSGANVAKTDLSSQERRALANLGITDRQIDTLSSDELAALEIQKLKEKSNSIKDDKLFYPQMAALGVDLDHETLQTIRQTSNSELGDLEKRRRTDKPLMNITDADAKKWVDFTTTVAEVTRTIKNKFEVRLSELAPSLERLSKGLGTAADEFIKKDLGPWIDGLASGLESLSKTIGSDETKNIVRDFFDDMKTVAEKMVGLVHGLAAAAKWLGIATPGTALAAGSQSSALSSLSGASATALGKQGYGGGKQGFMGGKWTGGAPGNTADAMAFAKDQLRKEGVSEEHLDAAAAALVGNAIAESGLNPGLIHDHGTGYGIYGARLDRRDRMLSWLSGHGFAKDSLEGQQRYQAHEAMTDKHYAASRRALMNATDPNIAGDIVEHNFEHPRRDNDRHGAFKKAYDKRGATVTTKKVSIRNQPGGDIFAMGFGNVYGAA
jgi:Phage tail lysozyme